MKIGARNIKTAIAVIIVVQLFIILNWDSPFYAAIAAVIGMQNTVENSYKVSINRMIGTVIGGIVGFLLTILFGNNTIIIGLGIILVIAICNHFNKVNAVVISCIVLIAIMTNLKDKLPHIYAIHRVFETSIGLFVAIIVNKFFKIEKFKIFK